MKKFAFLMAIVALFAMSASAFAANEGIDKIENTASDPYGDIKITETETTADEKATGEFYYTSSGTLPDEITLILNLTAGGDGPFTDMKYAVTGATGKAVDQEGADVPKTSAAATTFKIASADLSLTEALPLSVDIVNDQGESQVNGTGEKGIVTIKATSADVILSADGAEVAALGAFLGVELKEAVSVDVAAAIKTIDDISNLKLGVISPDKQIISADLATNKVLGLTFALDDTKKNLTIEGTPNATGTYTVALYTDTAPATAAVDGYPILGFPKDKADAEYILTTFVIDIDKTAATKVNEAIANSSAAVRAELAKVNDGKGGPVALIMDNRGASITSVDVQAVECDYTTTGTLTLTVISLDLKGATSVDNTVAWTNLEALSADVTSDDHVEYIPAELVDEESKVLTYTIDPVIFKKDSPIPVMATEVRAAAPAGFHDVEVDYTITFPKAVGVKPLTVTYTTYEKDANSSSGGACDMGLGLAAAALAVLALRKRSK